MRLVVTTDGSRQKSGEIRIGGFGRSTCGAPRFCFSEKLSTGDTNQAEYLAAFAGLKQSRKFKATAVDLHVDSKTFYEHFCGESEPKNKRLQRLMFRIKQFIENKDISVNVIWSHRHVGDRPIADILASGRVGLAKQKIAKMYPPQNPALKTHTIDFLRSVLDEDHRRIYR